VGSFSHGRVVPPFYTEDLVSALPATILVIAFTLRRLQDVPSQAAQIYSALAESLAGIDRCVLAVK
jgi:hypothetical protein